MERALSKERELHNAGEVCVFQRVYATRYRAADGSQLATLLVRRLQVWRV